MGFPSHRALGGNLTEEHADQHTTNDNSINVDIRIHRYDIEYIKSCGVSVLPSHINKQVRQIFHDRKKEADPRHRLHGNKEN